MIIVCAWCSKLLDFDGAADLISHGICPKCKEQVLKGEWEKC